MATVRLQLLPGEDRGAWDPDIADHWSEVYAELHELTRNLAAAARESLARGDDDAVREIDLIAVERAADRFGEHLTFWRRRRQACASGKRPVTPWVPCALSSSPSGRLP